MANFRNYKVKNVDEFIDQAAPEAKEKLIELRKLIKEAIPGVEEGISWGVPFYKYHGLLAGFAPLKNHITFGLVTVLSSEEREELEKKGYKTGKKTIQIVFGQKTPSLIIKRILKKTALDNLSKKSN